MFCLNDYDCVGFDLDNTLAEYNVEELMKLEYGVLSEFLIQEKGYDRKFLSKPFRDGRYFLQKGLFMDLKKGNIVKIGRDGEIFKACHGTKPMTPDDIIKHYGSGKIWEDAKEYVQDPLKAWNTPLEKRIRAVTDHFDTPSVLVFARIVDSLDDKAGRDVGEYDVWPHILEGLYAMFERSNFSKRTGGFFPALQKNPSLYYKKCSDEVLEWLKKLKKNKFVFLITGSNLDFATLTATSCLGKNWTEYFDAVVCYARKPLFFVCDRPFLKIVDGAEADPATLSDAEGVPVYSQGNWNELMKFASSKINLEEPKSLYVGDNLIQDVYSPVRFKCCDTVAISLELSEDKNICDFWGSYFEVEESSVTFWNHVIKTHAKISVPNVGVLAGNPLDFSYKSFECDDENGHNAYYLE